MKATIVAIPDDDVVIPHGEEAEEDYDETRDNESFFHRLRSDRLEDGKCPNCGTVLYEIGKKGVIRRKQYLKPLTIPGEVLRGQCLNCNQINDGQEEHNQEGNDEEQIHADAAVALALMEEEAADMMAAMQIAAVNETLTKGSKTQGDVSYKGEFLNGQRHGKGELTWSNGDKYVGTFWNGMREGEGTLHFADGSEYVGHWDSNKMHGEGTRRFPNGNVYTGHYNQGRRSGEGRCYYANGDMYVGSWSDDQMSGFGRYYYNNGQCFEGEFRLGKRNGPGKYQLTDGRVDIHRYENDKRVGQGVRWSANRKKAWKLQDGAVKGKVSLEEASNIVKQVEEGPPENYA